VWLFVLQVAGFNYQLAYSSQNPVAELPPSEKGFYDVFGSAWEWAEDHFAAFPGECVCSLFPCSSLRGPFSVCRQTR
jgi:formylglycine-generating enzyme required for sulfatase activity